MRYMRPESLIHWERTGSSQRFWLKREWSFGFHKSRNYLRHSIKNEQLSRQPEAHLFRNLWWYRKGTSFVALNVHYMQALSSFRGVWKSRFRISFIPRGARYEKQVAASSRVSLLPFPEFQQNKERRRISLNLISYFPFCVREYYICSRKKVFLTFILLTINKELLMCSVT